MKKILVILVLFSVMFCVSCSNTKNGDESLFNNGLVQFLSEDNNRWGYLNESGEEIIEPMLFRINLNGFDSFGYGLFYDATDYVVFSEDGAVIRASDFDDQFIMFYGFNRVITFHNDTKTCTLRKMNGDIVLETTDYILQAYYSDDFIVVSSDNFDGLGVYNKDLEEIIEPIYDAITPAIEGENEYFTAHIDFRHVIFDKSGNLVNDETYDWVSSAGYSHLLSVKMDNQYYLLNPKNGERIDIPSQETIRFNSQEIALIHQSTEDFPDKGSMINNKGEVIYESDYLFSKSIESSFYMDEFVHIVKNSNRINCLVTSEGEKIYTQMNEEEIIDVNDWFYVIKSGETYYLKNLKGKTITESALPIELSTSSELYTIDDISEDKGYTYNLDGDIVLEFELSTALYLCEDNYILLGSNLSNRATLYDMDGNQVSDLSFYFLESSIVFEVYDDGYIVLCVEDLYGVIDLEGNIIIPFDYSYIYPA